MTHVLGIYDELGRYLGPAAVEIEARPMGPWDGNIVPVLVCAWCPGWEPSAAEAGVSHGICPTCAVRLEAGERTYPVPPSGV